MENFPFQRLLIVGIILSLSSADPDCSTHPEHHNCLTTLNWQTNTTPLPSSSTTIYTTTAENNGTFTSTTTQHTETNDTTTKTTVQTTKSAKTTVIVAASVGTCAAIILVVLLVLIRRRQILTNCNLPHKQPDVKKSTSFNNNMYPDIEGTSCDSRYADIPLDNVDSIKTEDNVYQTIDPLQEQETVIDGQYSRISGNAWPLINAPYSHVAGDFQKPVVPDYSHIAKLEGTQNGGLKLKTNESDKSYDIIGNTKFGVTEEPILMDPTYNHTKNETYQAETATSDVDNYSHLHGLNKVTHFNETMTYNKRHEPFTGNPNFRNKEHGLCLKESDIEQKSIDKKEENNTAEVVKLPEKSKFSLGENNEENAVDHQYFVLEKVDK